jgi:hypothetical protein
VSQINLGHGPVGVLALNRTFTIGGAHCSIDAATVSIGVGAGRVSEPTTELLCKISVVAKAAGIGNLAERLACLYVWPLHNVELALYLFRIWWSESPLQAVPTAAVRHSGRRNKVAIIPAMS